MILKKKGCIIEKSFFSNHQSGDVFMNMKWMLTGTLALIAGFSLSAKVSVAPVFADNMVLQREMNVPVWGKADPGEEIAVRFAGQEVKTKAGADGKWMLKLAPLSTSTENKTLQIQGKDNKIDVNNVLVGEVWLCSGQSNMELPLWGGGARFRHRNGNEVAKQSDFPLIRFSRMVPYGWSAAPRTDYKMSWAPVRPDNISPFSAVGFFFGRELFKQLKNVPIGLISAHWGGTRIEPWTPPEGFAAVPETASIHRTVQTRIPGTKENKEATGKVLKDYQAWLEKYRDAVAKNQLPPPPPAYPSDLTIQTGNGAHQQPTVLYNRMVYPFVPFAMRGAIWYQGCSNLGDGSVYAKKMQALFEGWKKVFENPDLNFFFVQLAPFNYGGDATRLPVIWEAQQAFADANGKKVGMAVITDIGDLRDIHPANKEPVGQRLAWLALNRTYGKSAVKADSPKLKNVKIEGDRMILSFDHVDSWKTLDGKDIRNFEIGDMYGDFQPADVKIDGKNLIVSSSRIKEPKQVRFMWKQTCEGNLANEAGLLPGAFRYSTVKEGEIFDKTKADNTLVYRYNLLTGNAFGDRTKVRYEEDHTQKLKGKKFKQVTYAMELVGNDGKTQWVIAAMDPFTDDVAKLGVPVKSVHAKFQTKVKNLIVSSNVKGVKTGKFSEGNIEFWPNNYGGNNGKGIPGASGAYDFGDDPSSPDVGYGSMQVHNFQNRQTVFAYNNFSAGRNADIGIGNAPGANPDWTFTGNGRNLKKATLYVFIKE